MVRSKTISNFFSFEYLLNSSANGLYKSIFSEYMKAIAVTVIAFESSKIKKKKKKKKKKKRKKEKKKKIK